jgi:rare lipoprotein A
MKLIIKCLGIIMSLCLSLSIIPVSESIGTGVPEFGTASYYSYECAKLPMANGKPFDPEKYTCASWFYKFGSVLEVKSLDTGNIVTVTVTDRGPNKRLVKEGRIIDLSKRAFQDIRSLRYGLTRVAVRVKK